jgi:hypothetical protein
MAAKVGSARQHRHAFLEPSMPPTLRRIPHRSRIAPPEANATEVAQTARHYGALRFSMFTVFATISGALLAFPFTDGGQRLFRAEPAFVHALAIAGVVASLLFALAEWRLAGLLAYFQAAAARLGAVPLPPGHARWRFIIPAAMIAPQALTILHWLAVAWDVWTLTPGG